jgi:hypothetical protein
MRTATAALGTTMSRPSSLAGRHRVSLPISSQGAAKDCALSLTWSGRAAENAGLLKRQHRSRSQRRFPEDALVANVGCRRVSLVAARSGGGPLPIRFADLSSSSITKTVSVEATRSRPDKPPEGKLDEGEGNEGGECFGKVREILARRLSREPGEGALDHPAPRMRKPFMSSFRLTISVRRAGTFATAPSTCQALWPRSAQIISSQRKHMSLRAFS